jgi:hypothetical protein
LPDRFAAQYAHYKTAPWKNDEPIALIVERLRALDLAECDYRDVVAAMGSDWTELECDICGKKDCETVSRIGDEPAYEARWQDICLPCLASIGAWAAQAMAARSGETSGSTEGNSAVRKDAPIGGHDDD